MLGLVGLYGRRLPHQRCSPDRRHLENGRAAGRTAGRKEDQLSYATLTFLPVPDARRSFIRCFPLVMTIHVCAGSQSLLTVLLRVLVFLLELSGGDQFIKEWAFIPARFSAAPAADAVTLITAMNHPHTRVRWLPNAGRTPALFVVRSASK